ncbi:asparaginase (plasmid) [Rhizobium sp. TRM96647]|uniref:asparaginase n=1 Tax=unclassified Rhizobium TaxID=2613769 RepID=UPI0021E85B1A|nr:MULTISPECIES: asparaginase [unclassified Rhizobium]MCV3735587.1 asparaginase [Rhizobium sp. TRM96647]MCV3757650.1 asparaginase [Rhizobium sp. TRM96650]
MENPVLVEVTRGNRVESRHRGMVVAVDGDGKVAFARGDIEAAIFPRSACKAMQALPLVEGGAADAYGFGDRELALACASHSGEPKHVALAAGMLAAAGQEAGVLECGAHWSFDQPVLIGQARTLERPTALHNNCSGKHAGFVCAACHGGLDPKGYVGYDHPVQAEIRAVMQDLTSTPLGRDDCGIDGCSIPTYAVPLKALAHGFARMVTGAGLPPARARAARRLVDACMAEPFYVAGTRRACTRLMETAPGRIFAKTGAEGVFCAAVPEKGIAIALKCEDGATRAAEAMVAATLARFFDDDPAVAAALMRQADHAMKNWNGLPVAAVRVTEALRG